MIIFKKTENKIMEMGIVRSQKGIPCLWECGGGNTNTGYAFIIGDKFGNPKKPIFIRHKGELACQHHALIPIRKGDRIVIIDRHRDDYTVESYRIYDVQQETAFAKSTEDIYENMLEAGIDKSICYHCRRPMYIINEHTYKQYDTTLENEEDIDYDDLICDEE